MAGRLAHEIWARLEILKLAEDRNIQFSALLSKCTALFQQLQCLSNAFSGKPFYTVVLWSVKFCKAL